MEVTVNRNAFKFGTGDIISRGGVKYMLMKLFESTDRVGLYAIDGEQKGNRFGKVITVVDCDDLSTCEFDCLTEGLVLGDFEFDLDAGVDVTFRITSAAELSEVCGRMNSDSNGTEAELMFRSLKAKPGGKYSTPSGNRSVMCVKNMASTSDRVNLYIS